MKRLIKEILYAAHECGVCPDWGDKIVEDVLDILKRDGIVNQNNKVSHWVEPIDEDKLRSILPSRNEIQDYLDDNGYLDENGNFIDYVERAVQIGFELGYKTAKQE